MMLIVDSIDKKSEVNGFPFASHRSCFLASRGYFRILQADCHVPPMSDFGISKLRDNWVINPPSMDCLHRMKCTLRN